MSRLKISLNGALVETLTLEPTREYSFGRDASNDFRLESHPGISRSHFRVRNEDGKWIAEVVSKFGELWSDGAPSPSVVLVSGASFEIPPYEFVCLEDHDEVRMASGDSAARSIRSTPSASGVFEGDDESTSIAVVKLHAYARVLASDGREGSEIRLDDGPWIAGRDETCDIFLNDSKASRKQFEISHSSKGWFVKDLGSSNGTSLNGKTLPANELIPLKSGDVILAQGIETIFEMRDAGFAERAASLPAVIDPMQYMFSAQQPFGYPTRAGPHGMQPYEEPWPPQENKFKSNKRRLAIAGAVVALLLIWLFSGSKPAHTGGATGAPESAAFQKLQKSEKTRIENVYRLAQEFYVRHEYDMALAQLETIHKILPQGYERSLELAESIAAAKRAIDEEESIRRQREQLQRQEAQVREIVARCKPIAERSSSGDEIRTCLDQVMQIKPDDMEAQSLIEKVERRHMAESETQANQKAYRDSLLRGRALFEKAEKLKNQHKTKDAIAAFQAYLHSSYPDPDGLRGRAQRAASSLKANLSTEGTELADQARKKLDKGDFKGALQDAIAAQQIDPENQKTHETAIKAQRELNVALQALYADSVVFENFGQLDAAKEKWRKILETDRPHGDYWVKARNKLNSYGGS